MSSPRSFDSAILGEAEAIRWTKQAWTGGLKGIQQRRAAMPDTYLYEIDGKFLPVLMLFGLRTKKDGVRITEDGRISATLGWFRLETTLTNVDDAHVTTDYRWWTAIGPRTSFADDGLSFGTNSRAGVCIHFMEKVPSALSRKGHSALTVTVADLEGLKRALTE